ncbi:MAG: hypothetical protein GC204_11745 [Chloroflexi bacterium]|nr:hypothetical protein [Chloroflexota bacterium]
MRRISLIVFLLLVAFPVFAQDANVQITSPQANASLSGIVEITGTVSSPDLQNYFFEVADATVDPNTATWTPITLPSKTPVTNGTLAQLNTSIVADGSYTLRLRVFHTSGDPTVVTVGPLTFTNNGQIVAASTPTPTGPVLIPRPQVTNTLPIPVGGQLDNFDENAATLMQQAGMTWVKWQIPFTVGDASLVDVARDRINWSHEHGFFAFLSIKGNKDELAAQGDAAYDPLYAEFVGKVAALQPDAIQVWNEMNLDREWPEGKIDPRSYVSLLQAAHDAIKAVDPSIQVITGAPSPTGAEGAFGLDKVWNDDRYYLGMANAGAAQYADCLGIHYNEGVIAPDQTSGDPRPSYPTYYFQSMMQRALAPFAITSIPLCFSEMGYLSPEGYGSLPAGFAWGANTTVADQAQWIAQAVQIAAQTGKVKLIIIFNVNFTQFVDNDPQGGYAIIRPDGSCPACQSLAALRSS